MKIRIRSADEIERIKELLPQVREIHITQRPSKRLIKKLEELAPNLERILVSPSVYQLLPKNLDTAIAIEISREKRGRPRKYGDDQIKEIIERWKNRESARSIARSMGIPVRTVYHYISQHKEKRKKRIK